MKLHIYFALDVKTYCLFKEFSRTNNIFILKRQCFREQQELCVKVYVMNKYKNHIYK